MGKIEISVPQIQIRRVYTQEFITAGTDVINFCGFFLLLRFMFLLQDMKL